MNKFFKMQIYEDLHQMFEDLHQMFALLGMK